MDILRLSAELAVKHVMKNTQYKTMYSLAKELGVQTIQISSYITGTRKMSKATAQKFLKRFNIVITDVHRPSGRADEWN